MPDVVLSGDALLLRRLAALGGKIERKVAGKAARAALKPTLAAARANAPTRSGRLRRSIKLRALKRSRKGRVGARVTTGDKTGDFGGQTYYGAFVEFGYKLGRRSRALKAAQSRIRRANRNDRGRLRRELAAASAFGDSRTAVPPRHFMQTAAESTQTQAQEIFRAFVRAELEREVLAIK